MPIFRICVIRGAATDNFMYYSYIFNERLQGCEKNINFGEPLVCQPCYRDID